MGKTKEKHRMYNPKDPDIQFRETRSLKDFILGTKDQLAMRVKKSLSPLFDALDFANPDSYPSKIANALQSLGMTPYNAQRDVICALANGYKNGKKALGLIAEMGTGKTLMGSMLAKTLEVQFGRPCRTLVICPPTLISTWEEELRAIYGTNVKIINANEQDSLHKFTLLREQERVPTEREFWLVGFNRVKLSCGWKPSYVRKVTHRIKEQDDLTRKLVKTYSYLCPNCSSDMTYFLSEAGERRRITCPDCQSPLWKPDLSIRRWAPVNYIKKHLKGYFDFLIADEVHQMKGGNTIQGSVLGQLASVCKKTLVLTGTLSGGKASDIFYILQRTFALNMDKEERGAKLPTFHSVKQFIEDFGTLEEVYKSSPEDHKTGRASKESTSHKEKPGISPLALSQFFLDNCVFMRLADIADQLPPFSETLEFCDMEPDHLHAYTTFEEEVQDAAKVALRNGDMTVLGQMLSSLLAWPDTPQRDCNITNESKAVVASVVGLPIIKTAKDEQLVELMHENRARGRKVLIYAEYTGKWATDAYIAQMLKSQGFNPLVMKSTLPSAKRLEWIRTKFYSGSYDCLICQPRLVETGLNLRMFPEIIFYQTGYSTYTLRQASRRSYRPGQKREVVVRYMINRGTFQEKAMTLIASKLEASLILEGELSDKGLVALSDAGDSMAVELARALVGSLKVGSLEERFASYKQVEASSTAEIGTTNIVPDQTAIETTPATDHAKQD
ncbi:MAG: DEAD/DEAH box helicase, partial [Proteobacteria bacterium]|nr:DEAD/DEAH box helicase [Pseudomonadota bacterium]